METLIFRFTYPAILLLLVGGGAGLPVPEELVVLTAGVLAGQGRVEVLAAGLTCYVGVLAGDLLLYSIGRYAGPKVLEQRHFRRLFTPERVRWIEQRIQQHGPGTIVIARLTAGLRAPTFLICGISRVPLRRFVLADALAALLTVPLVTFLGYHFGVRVTPVLHRVGVWEHTIVAVLASAILLWMLVAWRKRVVRDRNPVERRSVRLQLVAAWHHLVEGAGPVRRARRT